MDGMDRKWFKSSITVQLVDAAEVNKFQEGCRAKFKKNGRRIK